MSLPYRVQVAMPNINCPAAKSRFTQFICRLLHDPL